MKNPLTALPIECLEDASFLALVQEQCSIFGTIDFPLDPFFSTFLLEIQNQIQDFERALQEWSQIEDQYSLTAFGELERALIFVLHKIKYHQYASDEDQKNAYYHLFLLWQQQQKDFSFQALCGKDCIASFLERLYKEENRVFLHVLDLEGAVLDLKKKQEYFFIPQTKAKQQKINALIDDFWQTKKNLKKTHQRFLDHLAFLAQKEPHLYLPHWEFCVEKKQMAMERWLIQQPFFNLTFKISQ